MKGSKLISILLTAGGAIVLAVSSSIVFLLWADSIIKAHKQVPSIGSTGLFEGGAQAGSGTTMPGGQIGGSLPSGTIGPLNPFGPGMSTTSTAASAVPGLGSLLGDLTP